MTDATQALLRHPTGFWPVFVLESCERYTYFGNRALLILFLVARDGGFGFDDATAASIFGLFTAGAYLASLPGGWIADRWLGASRAILLGGMMIVIGNLLLVVAAAPLGLFAGLAVMVVGIGLLKPNAAVLVTELYRSRQSQLDAAFTLYYMGICIGAAAAGLVTPLVATAFGWRAGYMAAAAGTALGLLQFLLLRHRLPARALPVMQRRQQRPWRVIAASVVAVLLLVPAAYEIGATFVARLTALLVFLAGTAVLVVLWRDPGLDMAEQRRIATIALLCAACTVFWSVADLSGSAFNLFAERFTDRELGQAGVVPAGVFLSINPALIVLLSPLLALLWTVLARRRANPPVHRKFAIALLLIALGLGPMVLASLHLRAQPSVGAGWLLSTYLLHTLAELCLSPIGLAAVGQLAPRGRAGQMIGLWYLAVALGPLLAAQAGGLLAADDPSTMAAQYAALALLPALCGAALWLWRDPSSTSFHRGTV